MQSKQREYIVSYFFLIVLVGVTLFSTSQQSRNFVAIGTGPSELSHIDYTSFLFTHSLKDVHFDQIDAYPGRAPITETLEPPAYYLFLSRLLKLFIKPHNVGAFIDYQLGLSYSENPDNPECAIRYDERRGGVEGDSFHEATYRLRYFNTLLLVIAIMLAFLGARCIFPDRPLLALGVSTIVGGTPTAFWNSIFVTNLNAVVIGSTIVFLFAIIHLTTYEKLKARLYFPMVAVAGITTLAHYSGVATLVPVVLFPLFVKRSAPAYRIWMTCLGVTLYCFIVLPHFLANQHSLGKAFPEAREIELAGGYSDAGPRAQDSLLKRYWVSPSLRQGLRPFESIAYLDVWWALFLVATIGLAFRSIARIKEKKDATEGAFNHDVYLFLFCSVFGSLLFLWLVSQQIPSFHDGHGHAVLFPLSVLLVIGFVALMQFLVEHAILADSLLSALFLVVFFTTNLLVFEGLREHADTCSFEPDSSVQAGGDILVGDFNNDSRSEPLLFERRSGKIYLAKHEASSFQMVPAWTKQLGRYYEEVYAGDMNGDGHADVLFFHPATGNWRNISGKFLVSSKKPTEADNIAINTMEFGPLGKGETLPLIGDINGDGADDILFYQAYKGTWIVDVSIRKNVEFLRESREVKFAFGGKDRYPFLFRDKTLGSHAVIGTYLYDSEEIRLLDRTTEEEISFGFGGEEYLFPFDYNGDGLDDLVSWSEGSRCLTIAVLATKKPFEYSVRSQRGFCPISETNFFRFNEHQRLVRFHQHLDQPRGQKREQLGTFDYRTGGITFLLATKSLPDSESEFPVLARVISVFDPGFLALRSKRQSFRTLGAQ